MTSEEADPQQATADVFKRPGKKEQINQLETNQAYLKKRLPLKVNLSLHLEGNTNLVATLKTIYFICVTITSLMHVKERYRVNIAAVDEGGESDRDAVPQLLLVSKSDLAVQQVSDETNSFCLHLALVVDLGAHCCSIGENIFCSNSWWKWLDNGEIHSLTPDMFVNNITPKVVAAEAELHPRETPVSRAGDTWNCHWPSF